MKKYTLEITLDGDELSVKSINDGFNSLELLGLFDWKFEDIKNQMAGCIKPNIVSREIVVDELEVKTDE